MYFDNRGAVLFCEVSSRNYEWDALDKGQRWGYRSVIEDTQHVAALCKHSVPPDRQINTRTDIESFQLQIFDEEKGAIVKSPLWRGNDKWQRFVSAWYEDHNGLRTDILNHINSAQT